MPDDQNPLLPLEGGTPPKSGTTFVPMNIEEEMRRSYLAYSMSVIVGRALPDARDGLKPVHRRILTAMDREGLQHNKRLQVRGRGGRVPEEISPARRLGGIRRAGAHGAAVVFALSAD